MMFTTEAISVSNAYNVSEIGLNLPWAEVENFSARYVSIYCNVLFTYYLKIIRYLLSPLFSNIKIWYFKFCSLPKDDLPLAIVESKYAATGKGVSDKDDFFIHTPRKNHCRSEGNKTGQLRNLYVNSS